MYKTIANAWRTLRCLVPGLRPPDIHFYERVSPDVPDILYIGHLEVYRFMSQFVQGRDALDVGCGTGYGSHFMLTQGATSVTGIDYADEAIAYAKSHFQAPTLSFHKMDAENLDFPAASFDVVTSSENLEHLPHPERNIAEIRRVLRPGGLLLIGTPNKELSSLVGRSPNPYHIKEFTFDDLDALLRTHFAHVHIFDTTAKGGRFSQWAKSRRRRRGRLGIEVQPGQTTIPIEHLNVNLRHLANTQSFMALAW